MTEQYAYNDFLNLLLAGNRLKSSAMIADLLGRGQQIKALYENIIKKSMYEIGEMWEYGKISVATEHLASAIVEAILNELYDRVISDRRKNKTAVAACVEGELHQIGIKMVADIFEMNGWDAHLLGANTPTDDLIVFLKDTKPDVLALSLSIYFHQPNLELMLEKVSREFPQMPVLVGGHAFSQIGDEYLSKYSNVYYAQNLERVEQFIKELDQKH